MTENAVFNFLVGWFLLLLFLILVNRTRLGHVVIYYSLMLMILLVIVSEYKRITPYLLAVTSLGQFNSSNTK